MTLYTSRPCTYVFVYLCDKLLELLGQMICIFFKLLIDTAKYKALAVYAAFIRQCMRIPFSPHLCCDFLFNLCQSD